MWASSMGWFAGSPEFIGGLLEALSVLSSWTIRIALLLGVCTLFPGILMILSDCLLYAWRYLTHVLRIGRRKGNGAITKVRVVEKRAIPRGAVPGDALSSASSTGVETEREVRGGE